ncbi:MAG: WYL domain-containing protein [Caldisericia bacterium]|nr:WYL domain-containing protein [Caldisericia bacterium]
MSNIHRIRWIDQQIRNKAYPNCKTIADHFEISIRQASRDIEYLRYSLEAPLEYHHEHQGYCYLQDAFSLPSLFISQEDREALHFIAKHYQQAESSQAKHLADLLLRISGELKVDSVPDYPIENPSLNPAVIKKYYEADQSMRAKRKVQIKYRSDSNELSVRIIHPYQWIQSMGYLYLVAHCEKRNDFRLFRLDRITRIIQLNETFQISDDFQAGHFKPFRYHPLGKPYRALVQWKKKMVFPEEYQFKTTFLNDNRYEIVFFQSSALFSALISLGESFKILEPSWLIDQYSRFLKRFSDINF